MVGYANNGYRLWNEQEKKINSNRCCHIQWYKDKKQKTIKEESDRM